MRHKIVILDAVMVIRGNSGTTGAADPAIENHPWFESGACFVDCGTGHQELISEIRSELNHETDILALNGAGDLRLRWK